MNCNNVKSDIHDLDAGELQHLVLEPLFSPLYIIDVPTISEKECTILYTDDTSTVKPLIH